jgi:restriction endonuclease S subunit
MPAEADVERYVGLEHLDPDSLRIRRWGDPSEVESTKLRFEPGDIIFGKRRVYQRKVAVADTEGICSAHAMVLRAKPDTVLPEFLPFFMQSDLFMERALSISVGSLSPTINWKALAKEEFILPPIQEQARMVEAIGASEALNETLHDLQLKAEAVLVSLAREKFENLCKNASMVALAEICQRKPQSGIYKSEKYRGSGVRLVNMGELFGNDLIDGSISMDLIQVDSVELQRFQLNAGDLLFGRRSIVLEGAGRCVLVGDQPEPTVFESSVLRVSLDLDRVLPEFVFEWLRSPLGSREINRIRTFTTVSGVAGSDVARLPIPLPDKNTQEAIASEIRGIRAQIREPAYRSKQSRLVSKNLLSVIVGSQ